MRPQPTRIADLLDRYEGILLDAFGVLVDGSGPLPGAAALLAELDRRGQPYAIVSNDASRSQATFAHRFASLGLRVAPERFVTSGSLLPDYFHERGLAGAHTCVLGTEDSFAFVRAAGGIPVALAPGMRVDAVAICDDDGTPFLDGMELALSAIVRALDEGRRPALVAPNPDLVYPKAAGEVGFTAGAMAALVELGLARCRPHAALVFDRLGKPEPHLFHAGARRLGVPLDRCVMIGDQLETDIAGARAAGVASALVTGISRWDPASAIVPTYLLESLAPERVVSSWPV